MKQQQNVIVLGAARSGTKLMRGLIADLTGYRMVPWDVNYLWRFGNESYVDDALPAAAATTKAKTFIKRQINRHAGNPNADIPFVEKTVGNVLRIPFVHSIFSDARFVHVIRDGRDVTESAARCWRDPPTAAYMLQKLKSFPWLACGGYGGSYAYRVFMRRLGLARHLASWGPRYPGIDEDVRQRSLIEVCALQWRACVEAYESARQQFRDGQILELRYEDLAREPDTLVVRLADFLQVDVDRQAADKFKSGITAANIGKYGMLAADELQTVLEITLPVLGRWGYIDPQPARQAA